MKSILIAFGLVAILAPIDALAETKSWRERWEDRRAARKAALENKTASWKKKTDWQSPQHAGTRNTVGSAQADGQGGGNWQIERTGQNTQGGWSSQSTGSGHKTDNGHAYHSATSGSTDTGKSWTTDRNGERVVTDDGTITLNHSSATSGKNGKTIEKNRSTTITKTEDGREWTSNGSRTGVNGQTGNWIGSGSATRGDDGKVNWSSQQTGTTGTGKSWSQSKAGKAWKTDKGHAWNTDTTRNGPRGTSQWSGQGRSQREGQGKRSWTTQQRGTTAKGKSWNSAKSRAASTTWKRKAASTKATHAFKTGGRKPMTAKTTSRRRTR